MHAEDRIIHFSAELIHPPVEHQRPDLQRLYFELSQIPAAGYDSSDFSVPGQPRFYSRRGKQTQSVAVFLPDRLLLIEEWTDISLAEFLTKMRTVTTAFLEQLTVPTFVAQAATIRSTFALTHYEDARVFLIDHACGQEGRMGPYFQRPVGVAGLRFVFPQTPEHPGLYNVNIESFKHDIREIFVEVKGVFQPIMANAGNFEPLEENMKQVRAFIVDKIFPYLNQYDAPHF